MKTIKAVDLFCGAGGTSTGLALACEELGIKVDLLAINHWDVALRTHEMNHRQILAVETRQAAENYIRTWQ